MDMGTPISVFQEIENVVKKHALANPSDFTGECGVSASAAADPMKFAMGIWFQFCYSSGGMLERLLGDNMCF